MNHTLRILSLRQAPQYLTAAIAYFQEKWATPQTRILYEDCLTRCIDAPAPLPQWYLLLDDAHIAGCAGLITNDFISRGELYPWLCALYIEEDYRKRNLGKRLIQKAQDDAQTFGFSHLYLCTEHIGYYEKYGFTYMGLGYHPWGEASRVYGKAVSCR